MKNEHTNIRTKSLPTTIIIKKIYHQLPRVSRPIFVWNVFIVVTIYTPLFPRQISPDLTCPEFLLKQKTPTFRWGSFHYPIYSLGVPVSIVGTLSVSGVTSSSNLMRYKKIGDTIKNCLRVKWIHKYKDKIITHNHCHKKSYPHFVTTGEHPWVPSHFCLECIHCCNNIHTPFSQTNFTWPHLSRVSPQTKNPHLSVRVFSLPNLLFGCTRVNRWNFVRFGCDLFK